MGKNRKSKKVVSQSTYSDYEDHDSREVPVEFLSSGDFQIVQKKRSNKHASEVSENFHTLPKTSHNSCKIDFSSDKGCHSSFWTNRAPSGSDSGVNADIVSTDAEDALPTDDELSCGVKTKLEIAQSSSNGSCTTMEKNAVNNCEVSSSEWSKITSNGSGDNQLLIEKEKSVKFAQSSCDNETSRAESSSHDENSLKLKCQKKKKKQKLKKLDINAEGRSHQSSTSSCDISPNDCPLSSMSEADSKDDEKHKKDQERKRPNKKQLAAIHEALKKAKEEEERRKQEEEEKRKQAEEAERLRLEQLKLEQEKKEKKKLKEKMKREKLKAEGKLLTKSQKQSQARLLATLEIYRQQGVDIPQIGDKFPNRKRFDSTQSDNSEIKKYERVKTMSLSSQGSKDSMSDIPNSLESKSSMDQFSVGSLTTESDIGHYSCSEESDALDEDHLPISGKSMTSENKKLEMEKMKDDKAECKVKDDKNSGVKLRSPVVCVLGHVDTGKTKILDYIRKTHVQDSEAGGITQQIGATMIPQSALKEKCKMVKDFSSFKVEVPGLLVIDTPGHESFKNLRSRGTSLCDIAILVVDIMHGLQPQTLESINLLKASKIPFVVALNKIDRIYGWKTDKDHDIVQIVNNQKENTLWDFKKRCQEIILQFAKEFLNAALFFENPDPRTFVSMVPVSAITGAGMGNLLNVITQLTQTLMYKQLIYSSELKATVLEVKVIPGLGTTVDVILVNGELHEGDTIILAGQDRPIVTQIRSLLMPQPLKELRVKNPYIDYKVIEGAQGIKISGKDLDKALAGMPVYVAHNHNEVEHWKSEITKLLCCTMQNIKTTERGVYVQASTLGSLEALLEYLTSAGVPYFGVKVGNVVKKDVMKASIMLEHDSLYATILAFDVKVEKDAQELADHLGVKILHADIIYHLFDMFVLHRENHLKKLEEKRHLAIFPCILTLLAKASTADDEASMTLHVTVEAGTLKEGTPLCVPKLGNLNVGAVTSIHVNGLPVVSAKEGESAIVTVVVDSQKPIQLEADENLVSRINRQSVEVLKEYYKDELCPSDWHLVSELKKLLHTT